MNTWIRYLYHYKQLKMVDNPQSEDVYYQYGTAGDGRNGAGRVVKETKGNLVDSYWYGALGEVVKKERTIENTTYWVKWRWDNFGRVRSIEYSNNFSVYYAYDAGGQVKGVVGYYGSVRTDYVKNIEYDEYGSRTKVEYGNGVVSTYSYDAQMHRLINLKTVKGDSLLQNVAYSYDRVGNILTRTENGVVMSDNRVKNIRHSYSYDNLYRLTEAEGTIQHNGETVHSYSNTFAYSSIGNIMKKLQVVKVAGENDPNVTYDYTYRYEGNKPHAVTGINENITYRYDANGNMIAVYDTAKNYNRVLYWDEENRLTKTVDTTHGNSTTTQYFYDTKGMRIIKEGPYGKSVYVDTGYVLSGTSRASAPEIVSNHVFVGNTRIASVVKHKDESQAATYYYATDHLGSSSVLTTQTGSYHERIEYLPYGETWLEDSSQFGGYSTPYKFNGKELDKETNLYYFGARYYDARISRWISTDPALQEGKYFPKPNDYETEHDFYWYMANINIKKIPGIGGVYNPINLNVHTYSANNPIRYIDPDGKLLGCYEEEKRGTKFINALKNWAAEEGINLDKRSMRALNEIGQALNKVNDAKTFFILASILTAGIDGLKGDSVDRLLAIANMSGITAEMPIFDEVKTALGAVDYTQLSKIAVGVEVGPLNTISKNAYILSLFYEDPHNYNQDLSSFWSKVYEITSDTMLIKAQYFVNINKKR